MGLDLPRVIDLASLSAATRDEFGFPFVMVVKHRCKREILDARQVRIAGTHDTEF